MRMHLGMLLIVGCLASAVFALPAVFTGTHTVNPGDPAYDNGDVVVTDNANSGSKVKVDPGTGATNATSTTVTATSSGFRGSVTGLEDGDTVNTGNSAGQPTGNPPSGSLTISGTGGTVNVGSNSIVTVTNTGPVQDPPNSGPAIDVVLPTGSHAKVYGGSTTTVST